MTERVRWDDCPECGDPVLVIVSTGDVSALPLSYECACQMRTT